MAPNPPVPGQRSRAWPQESPAGPAVLPHPTSAGLQARQESSTRSGKGPERCQPSSPRHWRGGGDFQRLDPPGVSFPPCYRLQEPPGFVPSSVLAPLLWECHSHVLHGHALHDGGQRVQVALLGRLLGQEVIWGDRGVRARLGKGLCAGDGSWFCPGGCRLVVNMAEGWTRSIFAPVAIH